ncbi:MAG TPA: hypothetical protein VH575_02425 [Gemmataceae bacterium]
MVHNCKIDDKRLEPLKECMNNWGTGAGEWITNYLSVKTVAYSCGAIARAGEAIKHDHDPAELALCKRLSKEAAKIMAGTYLKMGDESDHEFAPFFVTANAGDKVPRKLNEKRVRAAFGGTIWPECQITIEPLKEKGPWWKAASGQPLQNIADAKDCDDEEGVEEGERSLAAWRSMIAWFNSQEELHGACFVSIDEPKGDRFREAIGCIFPRLVLAITKQGSLVGLFGCVVHT